MSIANNIKKTRILVVSQYYYPENFRINDMCEEWVKRGYGVTVITGIPNYPEGKFYKGYGYFKRRKEIINGVKVYRKFIIPRKNSKIFLLLNYMSFVISGWFWKVFTCLKADYVFTFEVSPMTQALLGVWFSKKRNIPSVLYVQDLWPENLEIIGGVKSKFILKRITKMTLKIYNKSSKILTTSQSFKKSIEKRGINSDKVIFWPQYAEEFYKKEKPYQRKDPNKLEIIFTGNIGDAQGLDILPKIALKLKENGYDQQVKFTIVGDGRSKNKIHDEIVRSDTEYMFYFLGKQPAQEIPKLLENADVAFLSFTDNELFKMTIPAKLQSYLALGMPILGVVSGESKDIIVDGNLGLVSEPGNEKQAYQNVIKFLKMGEDELIEISNNSLKYFNNNYRKEKLMDYFDSLIESLGDINV